jgi:hypothetical protein
VPYRANIWALKSLGVERIISISACGSMKTHYAPRHIVLPDQIYDNTKGRDYSFFGDGLVAHLSFAEPFCPHLRQVLQGALKKTEATVHVGGTFIVIEGPRFSTRGESKIYRSWGVDIIGMTAVPEAQLAREREAADRAAAERRRAEEAERKRVEAAEAKRKAAEEEALKKAEAAEAKRQADSKAQAEREAAIRAEREAELQRLLAAEEEAAAFARSGVVDEYRLLLEQTIQRNWIRPASARTGLECTLYVTQAPGGTVIDVRLGTCNGDQAVRESITNAVYRASPLPPPRDPRAFQRSLEIVFRPTE